MRQALSAYPNRRPAQNIETAKNAEAMRVVPDGAVLIRSE
jgi:hypothetical protein